MESNENQIDRSKLIRWDETPVRWLGYHYLMGLIAAAYFMAFEEWLLALPTPIWWKVVFTTAVFPTCWATASVWLFKKGWLR